MGSDAAGRGIGRRQFLTWVVAAPTLTVAAKAGLDAADARSARADLFSDIEDVADLGDALTLAGMPGELMLVIEVTTDNRIAVALPRLESGQGITTMFAMLVAEELDARLTDVDVTLADADPAKIVQLTGYSNATRSLYDPTRKVAATTRAHLVTAAAQRWDLPVDTLWTENTAVHAPDGRAATYAELTEDAAQVTIPRGRLTPKHPSQFTVIGTPATRVDAAAVVRGEQRYALDLDVPGALPTVVARAPTHGGTVASYDDAAARSMPGVVAVARIPSGIAVVARTFYEAMAARDALVVDWRPGPLAGTSDSDIERRLRRAVMPFLVPPLLTRHVDASFDFAYVSHSPMETQSAVADVRDGRAEVWAGLQAPITAQAEVAQAIGLPTSAVTVHVVRSGGAFGRRLLNDPAVEAAQISRAVGRPVKLLWTRNDDVRHGFFRPASHSKIRATYGSRGNLLSFEHRVAASELDVSVGFSDAVSSPLLKSPLGTVLSGPVTQVFFLATQNLPYVCPVSTHLLTEVKIPVKATWWRSVYAGHVAAANEIVIDEIAASLRRDPVDYRRQILGGGSRLRAVLDTVAAEGGWGRSMPPGTAQGIGVHSEWKSTVAYLAEVDATSERPRVTRMTVAADVGRCINPRGVEAQMQGAAIDAISTVFWAGNHIDDGTVREGSFADFHYLRMNESPLDIDVHIIGDGEVPGGVGELGYPAATAAVANAYARATGTKVRRFPIFHGG